MSFGIHFFSLFVGVVISKVFKEDLSSFSVGFVFVIVVLVFVGTSSYTTFVFVLV